VLNQNPIWKILLVIVVVCGCALYALPNIYGEDHAVQISAGRNAQVTEQLVEQVSQTLTEANIAVKRIEFEGEQILVRVADSDTQLVAREALEKALGDDYFVAMNLAPDTPEWLASLGGTPMKLGLDLRGGVHFLMEVDMNSALEKALEDAQGDFRTALREEKNSLPQCKCSGRQRSNSISRSRNPR
jgi:preprotein translocase subunit SecD